MWSKIASFPGWLHTQWISRPVIDFVGIVVLVSAHAVLVVKDQAPSLMSGTPISSRPALYGAAAIVLSLTGTLGSVSVAQYLQARGVRAKALKGRHAQALGRSWKLIFGSTIVGSLLFLVAYRADLRAPATASGSSAGEWLFELGALIAVAALGRLFALFGQVVDLIVLDDTDPLAGVVDINPAMFEPPQAVKQSRSAVGTRTSRR